MSPMQVFISSAMDELRFEREVADWSRRWPGDGCRRDPSRNRTGSAHAFSALKKRRAP